MFLQYTLLCYLFPKDPLYSAGSIFSLTHAFPQCFFRNCDFHDIIFCNCLFHSFSEESCDFLRPVAGLPDRLSECIHTNDSDDQIHKLRDHRFPLSGTLSGRRFAPSASIRRTSHSLLIFGNFSSGRQPIFPLLRFRPAATV